MSALVPKTSKTHKSCDKENSNYHSNTINNFHQTPKQQFKTGVQIRNKLKPKNISKPPSQSAKKIQIRKNSHILQKVHTRIIQQNNRQQKSLFKENCNLSSSSSVRSLKSVTFSIDHSIDSNQSLNHFNSTLGVRQKSILKSNLFRQKALINSEKQSLASSHCSHQKIFDQAVENPNSNKIVLQKYEKILKQLEQTRQKYTDTIYPPCEQSLFLRTSYTKEFLENLKNQGYIIKWIRLTNLYPEKELCLWHPQLKSTITKGFIHSSNKQHNYMPTVLNSINKSYMMEKFFQNQTLSSQGIYYVKMHHTQINQWKYVIVDDFVPVVVSNRKGEYGKIIKPAFLDVNASSNVLEMWPFILQKAFAKYYSTYDSLIKGNILDFLEQVTGNYFSTFLLQITEQNSQKNHPIKDKIEKLIKNPYNTIVAQTPDGLIYPVTFSTLSQQYFIMDIQNNYQLQKINKQQFSSFFDKVHIIEVKKYSNHINCLIKQEYCLEKEATLHQNREPFILRSFTIKESTSCILALSQKEEKFYRNNKSSKIKQNYTYSWMRMILVMKQSTGYRWIDCAYEKKKITKIEIKLEPGQYYVTVLPEWAIKPYDLKLSLFSNTNTVIQRKPYENHLRLIEDSCMDLAQRFGKLTQINTNICSYNYIDYKIGFIIENINNQKAIGQVKILRTIDGLDSYNIAPINAQFQNKSKLQIRIPSLQSFTVVLKLTGGVDKSFLQQFDFGI